jgi:8-oxo-dGTP pyrophosphatase MutT (NUDIX family)
VTRLPEFSILVPVYDEAENIVPLLCGIEREVVGHYEVLIVYDYDDDPTLPAITTMAPPMAQVRLVKNDLGPGVVRAVRSGFAASRGWLGVVVVMADLSDPADRINDLVTGLRNGCDVVAGSRYMAGGSQTGGPILKRSLSRLAGWVAYWLTGVGIHDVTTNFRAYSRRLIETVPVESSGGFELGLELTVKCHLRGWRVGEVPSQWRDRSAGRSRFRLIRWLPEYLRWYFRLLCGDPFGLSPRIRRARRSNPVPGNYRYFGVYEIPDYGWTANRFRDALVIVPITPEGKIVLLRIRRPFQPSEQGDWELPGGAAEPGETLPDAARRELFEETGYEPGAHGRFAPAVYQAVPGMGWNPHHVVIIHDCRKSQDHTPPSDEGILEVRDFDLNGVAEMVRAGHVSALPTLGALWLYSLLEPNPSTDRST